MDARINAGYTIKEVLHVGNEEFVLGENNADPAMYVTWRCSGGDYYYWGHYFTDRTEAMRDLLDRVRDELDFQEHRRFRQEPQVQKDGKEQER